MLLSALITLFRPEWQPLHAMMAAIGAALFFTSDSLLGYDRFVRKLKHGQSYVHLTYHLGQSLPDHWRHVALFIAYLNGLNPSPSASCATPITMKAWGSVSFTSCLS